jgi:drug/metabolite transporter (DMT)-like permease
MLAFAGNSLLCRLALTRTTIDAASFTSVRLLSGALLLWSLVHSRSTGTGASGSWLSALALFVYAAGFSFAYLSLTAATGALLLFAAVQTTMTGYGLWSGERLQRRQIIGLGVALAGLAVLLLPGLSAPSPTGAAVMLAAGGAWGIYSLRGRVASDPVCVTTGNFLRAVPFALLLNIFLFDRTSLDPAGIGYAVASGALASAVGYVLWYRALPGLKAANAATVQLSVPVLTAIGSIVFLNEEVSMRLLLASLAILGGIAMVVVERRGAIRASAQTGREADP